MAFPYDDELHRAADEILDSALRHEERRARRARIGSRCFRVAALLAVVAGCTFLLTGTVSLVEIVFFAVLGASAVFRPEPSTAPTRPPNRTRAIGRLDD